MKTELERSLGTRFRDKKLLNSALTHRSAGADNYERLEFLGDGILNAVIGAALYEHRQQASEGDLSRLRASLVRESTLAEIARELELDRYISLGAGESGSQRRASVLADVLEALIGACYLDRGFETARSMILHLYRQRIEQLPDAESLKDAKTRLQEFLQARERALPAYEVLRTDGPAHKRIFEVSCRLQDSGAAVTATGSSRRRAEQAAAEQLLEQLQHG